MIDYYKELGLDKNASNDELCSALFNSKRIWIDRQNSGDPDEQKKASEMISLIDEALDIFTDPLKLQEYNLKLNNNPSPDNGQPVIHSMMSDEEKDAWRTKDTDTSELFLLSKYSESGNGNVESLTYEQVKYIYQKSLLRSAQYANSWIDYAIRSGNPYASDVKKEIESLKTSGNELQQLKDAVGKVDISSIRFNEETKNKVRDAANSITSIISGYVRKINKK